MSQFSVVVVSQGKLYLPNATPLLTLFLTSIDKDIWVARRGEAEGEVAETEAELWIQGDLEGVEAEVQEEVEGRAE